MSPAGDLTTPAVQQRTVRRGTWSADLRSAGGRSGGLGTGRQLRRRSHDHTVTTAYVSIRTLAVADSLTSLKLQTVDAVLALGSQE
jgi:hypothetical protein